MVASYLLVLVLAGTGQPATAVPGAQPPADTKATGGPSGFARVEVKGLLKAAPKNEVGHYTVTHKTTTLGLVFDEKGGGARVATALEGKVVVVVGDLEPASVAEKGSGFIVRVHSIAPVGADPKDGHMTLIKQLRESKEALVRFKAGRADDAVELCKKLGLEVAEVYGTGSLLLCRWKEGIDLDEAVRKLTDSKVIEYVVPNAPVQIPPLTPPVKK
ncbi:hypothetical protein VT84_06555 [Gemmata sp. SH-PL17]|uniref:hypothetical protein n=1 Tax=Gemmata sp. SH-PL17 TaxID=1630693 RepID=UPI00078B58E2|nr:hypothetical protein [Gemmata sp. SH-PL17]AMV24038.1 hypothetical protein VT84_06555 [Gemmata sp. SH-PL17]